MMNYMYFVGEASHLARDFDNVSKTDFPVRRLAQYTRRQHTNDKQALAAKVEASL